MRTIPAILFFLFINPSILVADTIYKSVDEKGNVTYSTTPTQDNAKSTEVEIAPPPSEEQVRAAQQRHDRNKEAAEILDENRKKREALSAEENRLKREQQKQLQQQQQAEKNNENQNNSYPFPLRRPGRPVIHPPVAVPYR